MNEIGHKSGHFGMSISSMEPLFPESPELREKAQDMVRKTENLGRHIHARTAQAIADILRTVNCYYSNLIEGHETHPIEIEKAMRKEYSSKSKERNLQLEARAHIEVQIEIEKRISSEPDTNVCSEDFLRWIHNEFYRRLPEEFWIVRSPKTGQTEKVIPGELRHHEVSVGRHIPPPHTELKEYLARIGDAYNPARFRDRSEALVALSAAHHRVLWVHPFGDGNGRVTRLMTDAYLMCIRAGGHGLWTASRGFAKRRNDYVSFLEEADSPRRDNYDGRGSLSNKALTLFCRFFLEICEDQIDYMSKLLEVDELAERVLKYGKFRESGSLPGASGNIGKGFDFRPEATKLLHTLVYRGSVHRSKIPDLLGLEERTSRRVVNFLTDDGFISSKTPKSPLELRIPAHAGPYFFPGLYEPRT